MVSLNVKYLYAHDVKNPPSEGDSCNITLKLVNSKDRIDLTKVSSGFQTQYSLSIPEAQSLGLLSSEQNEVDLFIENLILAANLVLRRTALSTGGELAKSQIEFEEQHEYETVVENRSDGKHITVIDSLKLRDTVHVMRAFTEEIDESGLISNLQLINKVSLVKLPNGARLKLANLKKSFNEYRSAMSFFDSLMIFKHLFNSLELATNSDGVDRKDSSLDIEVAKITNLQASETCDWRLFYNRTKHIDRTPKDLATFVEGIKNLANFVIPLRLAAETVIIIRLHKFLDCY